MAYNKTGNWVTEFVLDTSFAKHIRNAKRYGTFTHASSALLGKRSSNHNVKYSKSTKSVSFKLINPVSDGDFNTIQKC